MNPNVQKNLNDFIKTQRDEVMRMSQVSLSFKRQQEIDDDEGQYEQPRVESFDQSLSSKSKLINIPNPQFANKLVQKAEDFEQQRIRATSPPPMEPRDQSPYNKAHTSTGLYQTWNNQNTSAA